MRVSKPLFFLLLAGAGTCVGADFWPKKPTWPWNAEARSQTPDDESEEDAGAEEFTTKVDTPMVGEKTRTTGLHSMRLQGVGLVTGLRNTGEDPPISPYRAELLRDMKRRGIVNANEILRSPTTALVIVTADLPPLIEKGEKFDIKVRLPEDTQATSLNGGWLLETHMFEYAQVDGRPGMTKGHEWATASGPILVALDEGDPGKNKGLLLRGRIVAGGTAQKGRDMALYLRKDFASFKNSTTVAECIGERFFQYNQYGLMEPLAEAKTHQMVKLKLQRTYKDNFPRYLQVIRNIAHRETEVAQRVRMERLKEELLNPETAERSAIRLEAIGHDGIPVLRSGLKSDLLEVQFHSALALAYMGEGDGLEVLARAAREEPAFRVYAFAAMSTVDVAECHLLLRDLMHEQSAETRYGAFRTLTVLDPNHPFIRGEEMGGQFLLHVLHTEGAPMVHLTKRKKAEVVLFGADQRFVTPMAVRAGSQLLVTASAGKDEIIVSRHAPGEPMEREVVSTKIDDVIRAAVKLKASFPDIAQMLLEADRQGNLPSRLEVDALPMAGREYVRPKNNGGGKSRVGSPNLAPNIFQPDGKEEGAPSSETEAEPMQEELAKDGEAPNGLADVKDTEANEAVKQEDEAKEPSRLKKFFTFGRETEE